MRIWGLVPGHTRSNPGAISYKYTDRSGAYCQVSEYWYWFYAYHNIRNRLAQWGIESHVIIRNQRVDYNRQIDQVLSDCQLNGVTDTIHGHFNSFSQEASGCETLVTVATDKYTMNKAKRASKLFKNNLGFKLRGNGVKKVEAHHNGFKMLNKLSINNISPILIEPVFGHWKHNDSQLFFEEPWKIEDQIFQLIMETE